MDLKTWIKRCESEIGKPYIWGANGPDAYDCSGFVQFALSLINLDPPRDNTAAGLYQHFSNNGNSSPVQWLMMLKLATCFFLVLIKEYFMSLWRGETVECLKLAGGEAKP